MAFSERIQQLCPAVSNEQATELREFLVEASGRLKAEPTLMASSLKTMEQEATDQGYDWDSVVMVLQQVAKASSAGDEPEQLMNAWQTCMASEGSIADFSAVLSDRFPEIHSTLVELVELAREEHAALSGVAGGLSKGEKIGISAGSLTALGLTVAGIGYLRGRRQRITADAHQLENSDVVQRDSGAVASDLQPGEHPELSQLNDAVEPSPNPDTTAKSHLATEPQFTKRLNGPINTMDNYFNNKKLAGVKISGEGSGRLIEPYAYANDSFNSGVHGYQIRDNLYNLSHNQHGYQPNSDDSVFQRWKDAPSKSSGFPFKKLNNPPMMNAEVRNHLWGYEAEATGLTGFRIQFDGRYDLPGLERKPGNIWIWAGKGDNATSPEEFIAKYGSDFKNLKIRNVINPPVGGGLKKTVIDPYSGQVVSPGTYSVKNFNGRGILKPSTVVDPLELKVSTSIGIKNGLIAREEKKLKAKFMLDKENSDSRRKFLSDPTTNQADKFRQDFDKFRKTVSIDPRRLDELARRKLSSLSPDQNAPFDHPHPEVANDQARISLNVADTEVAEINQLAESEMGRLDEKALDESGRLLRHTEATAANDIAGAEDDLV